MQVKQSLFTGSPTYLDQGKQSLILVPEIALTPLHWTSSSSIWIKSSLFTQWSYPHKKDYESGEAFVQGEADVAVGARSALFAPFPNLGLLIVDEEHDDSYKQGDGVRYHARDMAVVRGIMEKCPVVLASATPSVESWFNAHKGRYRTAPDQANEPLPNPSPK